MGWYKHHLKGILWCPHYKECKEGAECEVAGTPERVENEYLPTIAQVPRCFDDKERGE